MSPRLRPHWSCGLAANSPIALAPGMSLNAYFTYSVCLSMHLPWRTALALVFFSGTVMFIAFVGMRYAKLVVANPATYVALGSFNDPAVQSPTRSQRLASGKIRHLNTLVQALMVLLLLRYAYPGWK